MAWMAMMGADSVAYHHANAAERADDHPGRALEYYASRGETPLSWGSWYKRPDTILRKLCYGPHHVRTGRKSMAEYLRGMPHP